MICGSDLKSAPKNHCLILSHMMCEFIQGPIYSIFVFPDFPRSNIFNSKLACASRFRSLIFLRLVRHVQNFSKKYTLNNIQIVRESFYCFFFNSRFNKINVGLCIIDDHRIMLIVWLWIELYFTTGLSMADKLC